MVNLSKTSKMKMFFLPAIVGVGHISPLVKAARLFASHPDVQVTIITTHKTSQIYQNVNDFDREAGHDIGFQIVKVPVSEVGLPEDIIFENVLSETNFENMGKLMRAVRMLSGPVLDLVRAHRADCLVSDFMNPWAAKVASEANIPLILFHSSNLFGMCVDDSLARFKPCESLDLNIESFVVPGLPDEIVLTRSRLPQDENIGMEFKASVKNAIEMSYCTLVNSFNDLEFKYVQYFNEVIRRKCCLVGPLHCYSGTVGTDKVRARDQEDNNNIIQWLNRRAENSVLYVSFGSYAPICKEQFHEIAHGLEDSGHPFIWVARANSSGDEQGEQSWYPEGFEERMKDSNRGLIVKTWAPQEVILGHPSVGAFMTHCGWNSCLESLSNGVPMITWPLWADQFINESFMVDVLHVGFPVGNEKWRMQPDQVTVTVTRDKIELGVRRMMDTYSEEVAAMRKRAQQFVDKSEMAYEKGGSSYRNVYALVDDLKSVRNESNNNTA